MWQPLSAPYLPAWLSICRLSSWFPGVCVAACSSGNPDKSFQIFPMPFSIRPGILEETRRVPKPKQSQISTPESSRFFYLHVHGFAKS